MSSLMRSRLRRIAPGIIRKAVDLELVKQVTVAFDPIVPTSRSARDFLKLVSSQKIKLEYPDVVTKEVLRSDQGPSSLTVVYEHGEKLEYQTDKLSTEVLLKLFREDSSMAVIRGHCARAGLNLDDFGKPDFPRVWVSKEIRDDPEVDVIDGEDDTDPNVEEEKKRAEEAKRAKNPLKASKGG